MKAHEFVKENGLEATKKYLLINGWKNAAFMIELKRLVESHDLVESFGSLEFAKQFFDENIECSDSERLQQAIVDVEVCQ